MGRTSDRLAPLLRAAAKPGVVAFLPAAFAFAVYLATMNRSYGFIDKGELAAVATTLGIAHPTGYPTLTLLGHIVTRLSPLRPVLILNILAALLTAAGVALLALLFGKLLGLAEAGGWLPRHFEKRAEVGKSRRKKGTRKPTEAGPAESRSVSALDRMLLASVSALFVGFTTTWWSQATGFEVYALHAFLLPFVTLLFLRFLDAPRAASGAAGRWWGSAFAFALGLAFTNHMSTIMLAPAFLFLYIRLLGWNKDSLQGLVRLIPAVLLGLLPYAYLPLRASMAPRLNWGNPSTWESFWAHIGGQQFHFAMFYAPRVFGQQTAYLFNTLVTDTAYVGLLLAIVGLAYLIRRNGVVAIWTLLLFLTCVGVSGLYDINDIGNYHLAGILAVGVAFSFCLLMLQKRFGRRVALPLGLLLAASNGGLHFREMDESGNFLVEDLTTNVLASLPKNAVIFSNDWDYWTSGSLYAQEVEGFRRDIVVLDPESLRAEWYLDQLTRHHGDLMAPAAKEVDLFRTQIRAFERAKGRFAPKEADRYFQAYFAMISALIERNLGRTFFVTEHVDPRIGLGWQRVPEGLTYRLSKEEGYRPQEFPRYAFRPWTGRVDPYVVKICELYTMSLLARARYEEAHGQTDNAREYGAYALSFDPGFSPESVPDFPLHIDDQVKEVIRNYRQLRERAAPVRGR